MFNSYITEEIQIFNSVKSYFESLPPLATDEYGNAFFDLVAQYTEGGQEYIMMADSYEELIITQIINDVKKLNEEIVNTIRKNYEDNSYLIEYLGDEGENYFYTEDEFANIIFSRFKAWIDDNFSLEDMLEDMNEEQDKEEGEDDEEE